MIQDSKITLLPFFKEDYIIIEYDSVNNWISVDWKGYQTEISVKTGANKILEALIQYKCQKVLNDNTNVVGIWSPAAKWGGTVWVPQMINAGCKYFAWIYSPSALSQFSTKETLKNAPTNDAFKTFFNINEAKQWLQSV
ncbi:MAG: hypothetical protein H7329_19060 [Opitutaceae bacterium]|nr:hypothetical protein [Cytophagales bacterium]